MIAQFLEDFNRRRLNQTKIDKLSSKMKNYEEKEQ